MSEPLLSALLRPTEALPSDDRASSAPVPNLLLLDDDPFMLALQASLLRGMQSGSVATAVSASAAMALLDDPASRVDIIVCDLNMPEMDGIEFLLALSARRRSCSVILLSGESMRILHAVQKLLSDSHLTVLGALVKPASRSTLRALLDRWEPATPTFPAARAAAVTERELDAANDTGQWLLHYQPKVDLRTGALVGVEALVRWNHPVHGLIYPDSFIGLAEDCGAIDGLTHWVLQTALTQQVLWRDQGLAIRMAVNVSMENLRTRDFVQRVNDAVRAAGAVAENLTLEVTESRLMATSRVALEVLVRLRMLRFGLSIDDFGTGHSSLVQLRDVPFNELKIDRGFAQGARNNQITRPILEGSIGIAKRLGMTSVAEGVETEDDWRLLREIGCDQGQGWFIGRPMAASLMVPWFTHWQSRLDSLMTS